MLWQIQGDARQIPLREETVQCMVTSPPYYHLRDYSVNGQIGIEKTCLAYTEAIVQVFREVWRVLRADGVVFLNLGDSYYGSGQGYGDTKTTNKNHIGSRERLKPVGGENHLKPKDLIGIPWLVAFALRDAGWYLRSEIIWHKPNGFPESVTDRPTRTHEQVFLLTKNRQYYYNQNAVRTDPAPSTVPRLKYPRTDASKHYQRSNALQSTDGARCHKNGPNIRSVWTIPTRGDSLHHFAIFPEALVRPCILAGSRPGDLVLDPFSGTGTVGKVALEHGRRAMMMDLSYDYLRLDPRKRQPQIGMGW